MINEINKWIYLPVLKSNVSIGNLKSPHGLFIIYSLLLHQCPQQFSNFQARAKNIFLNWKEEDGDFKIKMERI